MGAGISTVTFDVWETMIHDDLRIGEERGALRVAAMRRALARAGFTSDEAQVRAAYHDSLRMCEQSWAAGREVAPHDQLLLLLRKLDPDLPAGLDPESLAVVEDAYIDPIFILPPAPRDGLPHVLAALRASGVRIGVVCNTGRTPGSAMRRLFERWGVLSYFDALAFSNEEGIRKPDPEIFRRVLGRLGTQPDEAVHVGDDLVADVAGAKGCGMRAVLLRSDVPDRLPCAPDAHARDLHELLPVLKGMGVALSDG